MSDDDAFLRAILAAPDDQAPRAIYADWLEEHGENAKARWLRLEAHTLERISPDPEDTGGWTFLSDDLTPADRYVYQQRSAQEPLRQALAALRPELDPAWCTLHETLGSPFRPFHFVVGEGGRPDFTTEALPFSEPIGTRGAVLTFASSFRSPDAWSQGFFADVEFLRRLRDLPFGARSRGPLETPLLPFMAELPGLTSASAGRSADAGASAYVSRSSSLPAARVDSAARMTAASPDSSASPVARRRVAAPDLTAALKLERRLGLFVDGRERSSRLRRAAGPSGYRVHDDPRGESLFAAPRETAAAHDEEMNDEEANDDDDRVELATIARRPAERSAARDAQATLRAYVESGGDKLWHVLACGSPRVSGDRPAHYAVRFAVGRSPWGDRLIGLACYDFDYFATS